MDEQKHLHEVYKRSQGKSVPPEQEVERIYGLYRAKLKPQKLRALSFVNLAMVLLVMGGLMLGVLALPKPTESLTEKRSLAQKPTFSFGDLFSGAYTDQMRTYIADTFPLRENFVRMAASLNQNRGVRVDDVRIVTGGGNEPSAQPITSSTVHTDSAVAPSAALQTQSAASSVSNVPAVVQEQASADTEPDNPTESTAASSGDSDENQEGTVYNGIFISQGRAMSLFGGNMQAAQRYASVVNSYQQALPEVQVYDMVVPTSGEFYVPKKYASMSNSQKNIIDAIYDGLDSNVRSVNAYDVLEKHKDEYLYFRTDHHWTGLGAYYAYKAFCDTAGLTPVPLEEMTAKRLENFIGTMYSQSQDSTLLETPDFVEYYLMQTEYEALRYDRGAPYYGIPHTLWGEYAKSPNSYSVFLQGDFPLLHITTQHKNGKRLLMVKESFGNAFAPFLINHYEEVFIVDQRYFELPMTQFIKDKGINELLFLNNAFAACTTYHINCIANLAAGNFYVPPAAPAVEAPAEPAEQPQEEPKAPPRIQTRLGTALSNGNT